VETPSCWSQHIEVGNLEGKSRAYKGGYVVTNRLILTRGHDDLLFENSISFRGAEMMRMFILLLGVFLILSGCAGAGHYYKVTDNKVHIYLNNPDAEKVYFYSSLDQFKPHEAVKGKNGLWTITVPSGQGLKYFYTVDGKVFTPECVLMDMDDLGGKNCIYVPGL
jgi:hypothetical protein